MGGAAEEVGDVVVTGMVVEGAAVVDGAKDAMISDTRLSWLHRE
jgi:hypothetical protein